MWMSKKMIFGELKMRLIAGLIIALLALIARSVEAQELPEKYDYILIAKIGATILDYSAGTKHEDLVEELKAKKYKNIVDCVTYLEDQGWEVVAFGFQFSQYVGGQTATLRKIR